MKKSEVQISAKCIKKYFASVVVEHADDAIEDDILTKAIDYAKRNYATLEWHDDTIKSEEIDDWAIEDGEETFILEPDASYCTTDVVLEDEK